MGGESLRAALLNTTCAASVASWTYSKPCVAVIATAESLATTIASRLDMSDPDKFCFRRRNFIAKAFAVRKSENACLLWAGGED